MARAAWWGSCALILAAVALADAGDNCEAGVEAATDSTGQNAQGLAGASLLQTSNAVRQTTEDALYEKSGMLGELVEAILGPRLASLTVKAVRLEGADFMSVMCLEFLVCSVSVSAFLLWRHLRSSKLGLRSRSRRAGERRQSVENEDSHPQKLLETEKSPAEGAAEGKSTEAKGEKADADAALRAAVWAGAAPLVAELLRCGADPSAPEGPRRETPLHCAAKTGNEEVCRILLDSRADLDPVDSHGLTPLVVAAGAGWEGICDLLLDQGAGAGGLSDEELPPLLTNMLVRRIICGMEPPEAPRGQ